MTSEPDPGIMTKVVSYLPSVDGQTILSISVGAVITFWTFWLAYRKTVGAQEERTRLASSDLVQSLTRRIAVEREPVSLVQYQDLVRAKSFRSSVSADRLIKFEDATAIVFSDVVDNTFLDAQTKNEIINLLEKSRVAPQKATQDDWLKERKSILVRDRYAAILGLTAIILGTVGGFIFDKLSSVMLVKRDDRSFTEFYDRMSLPAFGLSLVIVSVLSLAVMVYRDRGRKKSNSDNL